MVLQGYGTVRFSSKEEAEKAIEDFNGTELEGRALAVKIDKCVLSPYNLHLRWSLVWLLSSLGTAKAFVFLLWSCISARPCKSNHEPLRPGQLHINIASHRGILRSLSQSTLLRKGAVCLDKSCRLCRFV